MPLEPDASDESSSHIKAGVHDYIGSSVILFLDQVLVASGNWLFWLVISKVASTSDVGSATTIYSLVLLTTTLTQLGLEYPLLKKAMEHRYQIYTTVLILESIITVASIPFVILAIGSLYGNSMAEFAWLAVGILVFSSLNFVGRFSLLGVYGSKQVLIIDVLGTASRFGIGYFLLLLGYGVYGILLSFLIQFLVMTLVAIPVIKRKMGFRIGNFAYAKGILRDALTNAPSKFSRTLIFSLIVILLASFGIHEAEIGIFYITLMISVVAGGLASSMAYMVIPASSESKRDLSTGSLRLGLSLTTPLIVALITAPGYILSLIGEEYISGSPTLVVLAVSILPSSLVMISISKYNNLSDSKRLILVGSLQIITFLIFFYIFVPTYGIVGAATSMLLAFAISSIPPVIWTSDKSELRYVINSCIAVLIASVIGSSLNYIIHINEAVCIFVSIGVSVFIIVMFKNTTPDEIKQILKLLIKRKT